MATGKPFSVWLSGDLRDFAAIRAKEDFGDSPSDYLRELVERDQEGRAAAGAPDEEILVALARRFHKPAEKKLAAIIEAHAIDQSLVMLRLIDALLEAMERGVDPSKPFAIFNSEAQMSAFLAAQPKGGEFLQRLRELVESFAPAGVLAEKPQAPYGGKISSPSSIPENPIAEELGKHPATHKGAPGAKPVAPASPRQTPRGKSARPRANE